MNIIPRFLPKLVQISAVTLSAQSNGAILSALAVLSTLVSYETSHAAPAVAEQAQAEKSAGKIGEDWVRLRRDPKNKLLALEVAIVRYVPAEAAQRKGAASYQSAPDYIDLVGAIHVGDRDYYNELNKRFKSYDALLYELVAPEGTVIEQGRGTSNTHPLGALQNGMKSMLEVEHQLEIINYTRPNFVHADMSPEEFQKSMLDRDESFLQMYFRMAGQAVAMQNQQAAQGESSDVDFMMAFFSKDRPRKLKIAFAKQFASMESLLTSISGPDGSTLITERNKRALEVLKDQQKAGKRKIGIFYGAGHLADMHTRLVKEFGYEPVATTWLEAWDLRP